MLLVVLFEQIENTEEGVEQIKATYERRYIRALKEPKMSSNCCGVLTRKFAPSRAQD
jgi:hypothetical protein